MFGWKLVRKDDYDRIVYEKNSHLELACDWRNIAFDEQAKLDEAIQENKRLFDYHNKRLTAPRKDKNGKWRNRDGTFCKAPVKNGLTDDSRNALL